MLVMYNEIKHSSYVCHLQTEIIRKRGFNAEEYYLRTEDGYDILVVRSYSKITRSTPVVIGHGIYTNSLSFVDVGHKSLSKAFISFNSEYIGTYGKINKFLQ